MTVPTTLRALPLTLLALCGLLALADVRLDAPAQDTLDGLTAPTRDAFVAARRTARNAGVHLRLTSGHRTRAEQQDLFDDAVREYGSVDRARRWVLPADESKHVQGVALDVGPRAAADWLHRHGARFGLCRTYEWEWWHFEFHAQWQRTDCPQPARGTP